MDCHCGGRGALKIHQRALVLVAGTLSLALVVSILCSLAGRAAADTQPFELFCAKSPVGSVAMNGVTATGTLTPSTPSRGQSFSVSSFQETFILPAEIVQAVEALGQTSLKGTFRSALQTSNSRPIVRRTKALSFDTAIPNSIPSSGVSISVPAVPVTIGPFKARSSPVAVAQSIVIHIALEVVGSKERLECQTFPNNSVPTGVSTGVPSVAAAAPVIATGS